MLSTKNLRVKNKKYLSYRKLREQSYFKFLEGFKSDNEKRAILTALVELVRTISSNDKFADMKVIKLAKLQMKISQKNFKVVFTDSILNQFAENFLDEYKKKNYIDFFRGDIVEYATVYMYKSTGSRLLHEPIFSYKRKKLVPKFVKGNGCVIDVVKVLEPINEIHLYECKADLDNFIISGYNKDYKKRRPFIHKLNYMDFLEKKLNKFSFDMKNPITVKKNFVSLNTPTKKLPKRYSGYERIDLLVKIRLGKAQI